jgi:predicted extracellular nuclease
MKINPLFLCLLLVSCSDGSIENQEDKSINEETNSKKTTMTESSKLLTIENNPVVFYNVENLFDTENDPNNDGDDEYTPDGEMEWTEERYQTKLSKIVDVLRMPTGENPLLAGFCEIENRDVLEDLIQKDELKSTKYKVSHFNSNDRRGIDVGLIYDTERFELIDEEKIIIHLDDEPEFVTRDILHVTGKVNNGEILHVFVNHWPSRREGKQETEPRRVGVAEILRAKIDEILKQNPDENILVMGDFNDTPIDKSIREVLQGKGMHELKPGDLVNFMLSEFKNKEGSIVHDGEWELVDQFLVSQNLVKEQELYVVKNNAHIINRDELLFKFRNGDEKPSATYGGTKYYGGYSDHLPIYLLLNTK